MIGNFFFYGLVVLVLLIILSAALASVRAAPYVPTWQRDVRRMLRLAKVQPGEVVVDLGAGDGRFLLTAVKEFGARAVGYEFSILPFFLAKLRIVLAGCGSRISVRYQDFFREDLGEAHVVTCFLTPRAMEKLKPKFMKELKPGTRIVSYAFKLKGIHATIVDKPQASATPVFLYTVPLEFPE